MTTLLTGHKGFIGTNLINCLFDQKADVVGLDYQDCDLCEGYPPTINSLTFDTIIHLAAETDVRDSLKYPEKCFIRNCQSTINMLELARSNAARFIFASSQAAQYCLSPYGSSKLACEALIASYCSSYGLSTVILRLSNVYGPHSFHKQSVIPTFIKQILKDEPITVYGSGDQTRDFIYISDIVKSILNPQEGLSLISSGHQTSINTLINTLFEISGRSVKVIYLPPIEGEVSSLPATLKDEKAISLKEGLEKTFNWFANEGLCNNK